MLSYENLVTELEHAWDAVRLHEHALIESVTPAGHDRSYKAELFPEHPEPLREEDMPPWVEVAFTWSALHQLRSEGHDVAADPMDITWTYTVNVRGMAERSDTELVRIFQRAVTGVYRRLFPVEAEDMETIPVEVRRYYQGAGRHLDQVYVQLLFVNISDLSDQWEVRDPRALRDILRQELLLARGIIDALADVFAPDGRGGYRTVDAA
jgi:hypothetical protein